MGHSVRGGGSIKQRGIPRILKSQPLPLPQVHKKFKMSAKKKSSSSNPIKRHIETDGDEARRTWKETGSGSLDKTPF